MFWDLVLFVYENLLRGDYFNNWETQLCFHRRMNLTGLSCSTPPAPEIVPSFNLYVFYGAAQCYFFHFFYAFKQNAIQLIVFLKFPRALSTFLYGGLINSLVYHSVLLYYYVFFLIIIKNNIIIRSKISS